MPQPSPLFFSSILPAGFPFCFKSCGLVLAVLLVLVTLAASELSMRLLLFASQLTGRRSYDELARHAFGRAGQAAVQCCVAAVNVGSVVSYLLVLTDTVSSVAGALRYAVQRAVLGCWGCPSGAAHHPHARPVLALLFAAWPHPACPRVALLLRMTPQAQSYPRARSHRAT